MKKIMSAIAAALFTLLTCIPAYAAETVSKVPGNADISVYARYVDNTDLTTISTDENGDGSITLPDGTEITVSNADKTTGRIVIEEVTDNDVLEWAAKLLGSNEKDARIFFIYQIQEDGTAQPVRGVTVTIQLTDDTAYTVYSLKDDISSKLNAAGKNGSVKFETDGSSFYALCKASGQTSGDTPPQTGDHSNLMLWFVLLFVSGAVTVTTVVHRKMRSVK